MYIVFFLKFYVYCFFFLLVSGVLGFFTFLRFMFILIVFVKGFLVF